MVGISSLLLFLFYFYTVGKCRLSIIYTPMQNTKEIGISRNFLTLRTMNFSQLLAEFVEP